MSSLLTEFYVTGGTLRREAACYVVRQADEELHAGLAAGRFCYVLTARQMGKSSLMVRTAARLREEGCGVAILDLTAIGQNLSAEQWYRGLLSQMGYQLELEDELIECWRDNKELGAMQRWMRAIREVVLPRYPGPVAVFIDEIDAVLSLPFSTDEFFAAIREFYNRRTEDAELERLTFCLLGVASPADLIRDTRTTPFNIGQRIELHDFTEAEASALARGLGCEERLAAGLLECIHYWTSGHPYLTQRLCQAIAAANPQSAMRNPHSVDWLCAELFFSPRAQEFDDNLLFVRERMLHSEVDLPSLLQLYERVRRGKRVRDDEANPLLSVLRLSGIARVEAGRLRERNRIYARVFDREWIRTNMPDAEVRRQRAAFRRGLLRAASIAAVIIAVMAGLAFVALQQRNLAKEQAQQLVSSTRLLQATLGLVEAQRKYAEVQQAEANKQRQEAVTQKSVAEQKQAEADQQRQAALVQRASADEQRLRAEEQELATRRALYAIQIKRAQQAWETTNIATMHELLMAQTPKSGQEDLRGFEWFYLWRLINGEHLTLRHAEAVNAVAFSPDGRRLATASLDQTVKLWDATTGRELFTISENSKGFLSVAFSPDGTKLAAGNEDGTVYLWDAITRKKLMSYVGHSDGVKALAFSSDGMKLVTGSWDQTIRLWELATARSLGVFTGHEGRIWAVALSPDGKQIASASQDHTIRLWDAATTRQQEKFNRAAACLAFSSDGKMLAMAVGNGYRTIELFDLATKQPVGAPLNGHAKGIWAVAFSKDGKRLASAAGDLTAKVWDVATRQEIETFVGHSGRVVAVALSPDGAKLATASEDHTAGLWEIGKRQLVDSLAGVSTVSFSPDGQQVFTGSPDHTAKLWDVATGRVLQTFTGHSQPVGSVAFSPDGRTVATASDDLTARLWEAATGRLLFTLTGHTAHLRHVAFSPDSLKLVTGSGDHSAMLWDVTTGRPLATLKGHQQDIISAAFSPDGKRLATASSDSTAKLWEVDTGRLMLTFAGHTSSVESLVFSPDGATVATASADRTARIWNAATGQQIDMLSGHSAQLTAIVFSPDGKRLVTGDGQGVVKVWDVVSRQELLTLVKAGGVWPLKFSPDGRTLAAGGSDRTVKLWRGASDKEVWDVR